MQIDIQKQVDGLLEIAATDAFNRQCHDALTGRALYYFVYIRPAYSSMEPAAPFIGLEAPSKEWRRVRGLVFSCYKSVRQNIAALRDAFMALPLYATAFCEAHDTVLE
jgi:hypothetical protein